MTKLSCHFTLLPDRTWLIVRGGDAHDFLAAQLSQLPPAPGLSQATLAAWHDAKGRVQALFHVTSRDGGYWLLTHASVAADIVVALRRYVLRADVEIDLAQDVVGAMLGSCGDWLEARGIELGATAGSVVDSGDVQLLRLGPTLVYAIGPATALERLARGLDRVDANAVDLAEIRLGAPLVNATLRGLFLPQMLNLDLLGGVAFDKGCYPGQEIIARTQHLGAVKRRLRRFVLTSTGSLPASGAKLLDAASREVGVVVRAAAAERGAELLAVVELDALGGPLTAEWNRAEALHAPAT